jgi:hypothetical protein
MKKLFTILLAMSFALDTFSQAPQKMSYQAVIRNSNQQLVKDTQIGMKISILQGTQEGIVVYSETLTPITNINGLVSIEFGGQAGFSDIKWLDGPYFLKTETDPTGGNTYTITGTSLLLSVPYALHSKTAESLSGAIIETDPAFTSSQAANITASDISNLSKLSGVNTGDQDLSNFATKTALGDSTAQVRSEIPDVIGIAVNTQAIQDTAFQIRADIPDVSGFLSSETDPAFTSSQAANITASDISNLGKLSGVNTGDQDVSNFATKTALGDSTAKLRSEIPDVSGFLSSETDPLFAAWDKDYADLINSPAAADGSETKITAGINVTVTGAGTNANPYVLNASGGGARYLGEEYLDGIIFYLYTGSDGQQHGLVVSKTESTGTWSGSTLVGADRTEDGAYNTNRMPVDSPAKIWVTGLGAGWYLPSIDELSLLWHNRYHVNKTARAISSTLLSFIATYWSSTEPNTNYAFAFHFLQGSAGNYFKSTSYSVRAVRAF